MLGRNGWKAGSCKEVSYERGTCTTDQEEDAHHRTERATIRDRDEPFLRLEKELKEGHETSFSPSIIIPLAVEPNLTTTTNEAERGGSNQTFAIYRAITHYPLRRALIAAQRQVKPSASNDPMIG